MKGSRARTAGELASLVLVPLALALCLYFQSQYSALLTTLAVTAALVPFFLGFERDKLAARQLMPLVVFTALAVAGRLVLAPFPSIKPVSALVIMAGVCFGKRNGFMVGALVALVSNFFFGQGPWTPWQMYGWGLMGYVAGAFEARGLLRATPALFVFAFLAALAYGLLLDSYYYVAFVGEHSWASMVAAYGVGAVFSLPHAVATVVYLAALYLPWKSRIGRLKRKYGIC